MKIVIKILTGVLILSIAGNILLWGLYHASGHKIPAETDVVFRNVIIGLIVLLCVTIYFRNKE